MPTVSYCCGLDSKLLKLEILAADDHRVTSVNQKSC